MKKNSGVIAQYPVICAAFCALLFALCGVGEAQQAKKVSRIGYLSSRDTANDASRTEAIRLALRDLGYIEGQNISIEYRYAEGKRERFLELATELVRAKVDIIVAAGGDVLVQATIDATKTIPIVMSGGGAHPVKAGFVQSLARPGGNVTGITLLVIELAGKRLELLKETIPQIYRVAALYDPTTPASVVDVKEILPAAARPLSLVIQPWEMRGAEEIQRKFNAQTKERPDALYVSTSALLNTNQKRIASFGLKNRLPSIFGRREYVENGGLMYYGADVSDSYRRVAWYVDRIVKGAKPADLPVEQPSKFELVINLRTAKQIGLTVPQKVLARADKVIK
jgi:putative ABC transport system substrate-binding protein